MTVLRTLPQLTKLDNIDVSQEELEASRSLGDEIPAIAPTSGADRTVSEATFLEETKDQHQRSMVCDEIVGRKDKEKRE